MNKNRAFLTGLVLGVCFLAYSFSANAQHPALGGGTGTSSNPYQIKTSAHLKSLADFVNGGTANGNATAGVYYIVINDLDLTAYAAGEGWNPIGYYTSSSDYSYFQGNFNGNGKKVTNLKINRPTTNYQGLFGRTSGATIQNLGIENCDIAGQGYIGGLVGYNSYSTISNCYATGNVSGTGKYIGGLVGYNEIYSIISNCYATGNVSGSSYVGGLAGYNDINSIISYCYAAGNVSGTSFAVGGLVGENAANTIKNCIAANDSVVSTANTIYINRICSNPGGTFQNNYALSTMVVKNSSGNVSITSNLNTNAGMSKSMSDFQNLAFYSTAGNWNTSAWDMTTVWNICNNMGLPWLRWQGINCQAGLYCSGNGSAASPYQICTAAQLKNLADFVNGGTANGDATAGVYYIVINDLDLTDYTDDEGWNPIGYYTSDADYSYFQGNFNGNGKKVTNLTINRPTADYQGLFGYTSSAAIKNIGIENCDIAGRVSVGGLVGANENNSTISNCYATGNVSGTVQVGGLVGGNADASTISNCYATAKVSGTSNYVGGLVGINFYSSISNCYATGKVSGTGNFVGGLAGESSAASIINCIAANDSVVSTANTTTINRICGDPYGTFQNNYALSTMVVKNSSGNVTITSNLNTNAGMSKLITDLQNITFYTTVGNWNTAAWNMTTVWDICSGKGLPWLRWQNVDCFVPVNDITGLPATASAGVPLTLTGTVNPSDATNQTITWSVKNAGTTGATISGNTLNTTATGTATLTATIVNGLTKTTDYKQDFAVTVVPIPVTNISGIPTTAQINTMLTLSGTVEPSNATYKTIVWSLVNPGTTGATVSGTTFFASTTGVALLSATIKDGVAIGTDYEKQFTITVSTVGIEQLTMNNEQLTIYPNPTSGKLIIDNGQLTIEKVEICDLSGRVVEENLRVRPDEQGKHIGLPVQNLPSGVYFVKITTEKGVITRKFVKE